MTRKHLIYVLVLYGVLICGCLFLMWFTEKETPKCIINYDREIAIVGEYAIVVANETIQDAAGSAVGVLSPKGVEWIFLSDNMQGNLQENKNSYTKVYLDKSLKFNILKIFCEEGCVSVRHTSYSFTVSATTTLYYDVKNNKGYVARQIEERACRDNEWQQSWSDYFKEFDAGKMPVVLDN